MIRSVPRKPAAVVFDFDGVILDSETPEYESHRRIFERCGATLTVDDWCDQIGVWTGDWRSALAPQAERPDRRRAHVR